MRHSLSWIGTGIRLCDVVRINPVKIKKKTVKDATRKGGLLAVFRIRYQIQIQGCSGSGSFLESKGLKKNIKMR